MNSPEKRYPQKVTIERTNSVPETEQIDVGRFSAHRVLVNNGMGKAALSARYEIYGRQGARNEGTYVDGREVEGRRILGFIGPIWSVNYLSSELRNDSIASLNGGSVQKSFEIARDNSPFSDGMARHLEETMPWLLDFTPYTGNIWMAGFGDSSEEGQFPSRKALVFKQGAGVHNPFTPPDALDEIWNEVLPDFGSSSQEFFTALANLTDPSNN